MSPNAPAVIPILSRYSKQLACCENWLFGQFFLKPRKNYSRSFGNGTRYEPWEMMPNKEQEPGEDPNIAPESELPGEHKQLQSKNRSGEKAKFKRKLKLRNILARALLVLLFAIGFFLSVFPWGKATIRTLFLLPEILSVSQPGLLTLAEEPIRHTRTTVPSLNGTVFLDVYAPANPPAPIPGAREGLVVIPGAGDERADKQLINFSQALARGGLVVMDM